MGVDDDVLVRSILSPFLNDLWIERRLKLKEVLARLAGEENLAQAAADDDDDDEERRQRRDWIQFIQFLEEHCSGVQFALQDKQWGELLNLMLISRKLNHRSVRFRDILANKKQIESNAQRIRSFNATAQLAESIESGLDKLERLVQSCRLVCSVSKSPNHRDNSSNNKQHLDKLSETRAYLNDKCRPLLYSLSRSLRDERLAKDVRLEIWRQRESKLNSSITKMSDFVAAILSLELKLSKISYLEAADKMMGEAPLELKAKPKVRESIEACREELKCIQGFLSQTISLLHQLANRATATTTTTTTTNHRSTAAAKNRSLELSVPMIKVFEPKEHISNKQIHSAIDRLDKCQRELDSIMQSLRGEFGRFYFLNDQELLRVVMIDTGLLSCTKLADEREEEEANRRLICKLFNNSISCLLLDDKRRHLTGVKSPQGEAIMFAQEDFVPLRKPVQVYSLEVVRILNEVQRKLRKTLKFMLFESLSSSSSSKLSPNDYPDSQLIDFGLPIQLMNLAECVKFCSRVEACLSSSGCDGLDGLIKFYEQQSRQLHHLPASAGASPKAVAAAVSMNVQFVALLMSMRYERVRQVNDWIWQKQVRYYVAVGPEEDHQLEVRIGDAKFRYKFDYLCATEHNDAPSASSTSFKRLIRTETTERCFLLASQAVCHLRLGANPFGPAGGGKTETIKALGHLLGQQVIVHNCDETNDAQSLDRLVWGLAHTGLWGCFDEFNRLSSSAMSLVSASLELVQSSIRENRPTVERSQQHEQLGAGELMCIDRDSAFFITLNPAAASTGGPGARYGGRRQLPANLRSLFLPVSMARVQIGPIVSETLLALSIDRPATTKSSSIEHLNESTTDSGQIVEIGLRMERLLERLHQMGLGAERCEWDLRLVMAALQRLKLLMVAEDCDGDAQRDAAHLWGQLVGRALSLQVEPRLSPAEFGQFLHELSQVFGPEGAREHSDGGGSKVDQLRRELETRAGVLLVGPAKSGKSSTWRSLFDDSMINSDGGNEARDARRRWIALNPKSCSRRHLFGGFLSVGASSPSIDDYDDDDDDYHDDVAAAASGEKKWRDGCLTAAVRWALDLLHQERASLGQVCIVLDGPVDPDWIESLNSVLDDNRVLTLGSGERLNFCLPSTGQSIKLIFETDSIKMASPATISRLGLLHFAESSAGQPLREVVQSNGLEELDRYLALDNSARLMIIIICKNQLRMEVDSHLRLRVGEENLTIYSCGPHSHSGHLIDLLDRSRSRRRPLYLIHNVDLIERQDQWGSRSFLELLRFVLDYGGYYRNVDGQQQFAFEPVEAGPKFVLTCNDDTLLEETRLANKASLVMRLSSNSRIMESVCKTRELDTIEELLRQKHEQWSLAKFENRSHLSIREINRALMVSSSDDHQEESRSVFHFFGSSSEARGSLELLKKVDQSVVGQKFFFILHDLELALMDRKLRAKLMHQLNWLADSTGPTKFILVTHDDDDDDDGREVSLQRLQTRSITTSTVFALNKNRPANWPMLFSQLIDTTSTCKRDKILSWLREKISVRSRNQNGQREGQDEEKLGALVGGFSSLYQATSARLSLRQKALKNGLNHLRDFDLRVEQMRSKCEEQELLLQKKSAQIEQTSSAIDSNLRESERQCGQLSELRKRLQVSRTEMTKKGEQLERELAQVKPMLEASKADIRQHLRAEALNEIRTLRQPPKTIKDILDALFILLGQRDLAWASMKSYLATTSLRDELTNYQFESRINGEMLASLDGLMGGERAESFALDQARRASRAVVPILGWIRAALEYGRALIRSGPLRDELQRLRLELAQLDGRVREAEAELEIIEQNIQVQEDKLSELRKESDQHREETSRIQQRLERSQRLRVNLECQMTRWAKDLHRINSLVAASPASNGSRALAEPTDQPDRLIKLCLMTASLAFNNQHHLATTESEPTNEEFFKARNLPGWLAEFDLSEEPECSNWIDFIRNGPLGLVLDLELDCGLWSPKAATEEQSNLVAQLVALRQFLELYSSPWIAFIPLDSASSTAELSSGHHADEEQVLESLCRGNILARSPCSSLAPPEDQGILFVRLVQTDQLHQILAAAATSDQIGKLICIDVRKIPQDSHLDLAHFLLNRPVAQQSNGTKVILVGSELGQFEQKLARYLVRFPIVKTTTTTSTNQRPPQQDQIEQVQASILNSILEIEEPNLMKDLQSKQNESCAKQKDMQNNEIVLLSSLVATSAASSSSDENFSNIMRVLDELQQSSLELEAATRVIEDLRQTLDSKRLKYSRFALEFSSFYVRFLAQLEGFSRLTVKKYTQLLLLSLSLSSSSSSLLFGRQQQQAVDVDAGGWLEASSTRRLIVRHAMLSMDPPQRLAFVEKLREGGQNIEGVADLWAPDEAQSSQAVAGLEAKSAAAAATTTARVAGTQLGKTILAHARPTHSGGSTSAANRCQLMVVLHDPSKSSSPQQELDYLFGGRDDSAPFERYDKLYATGDGPGQARLERSLRALASNSRPGSTCLCIANAHLSAGWLNANLIDCLEKKIEPDSDESGAAAIRLLILIGEASSPSAADSLFDGRILDRAQLKYWHDELALSLIDRFDTFVGSSSASAALNDANSEQADLLRLQLILLHVVCQERAAISGRRGRQTATAQMGWLRAYNFDCDQLNLALRTLDRLAKQRQAQHGELRERLSDYMADIVYGSRMETGEDERQLGELVGRFLRRADSARDQLALLEQLRGAPAAASTDYERLLEKLIGLPTARRCSTMD